MFFLNLQWQVMFCEWAGRVFQRSAERKKNAYDFTNLLVRARGRISCLGLRVERTVLIDANGNKQQTRGGGRVCRMRWNSVMQMISRLQRRDGQFSCSNIPDLEAWKGARRIDRATAPWTLSRARASPSRRAPCQTGHAYSSLGQRKYIYSCWTVDGFKSFDIHRRRPARWDALRRSWFLWPCQSRSGVIISSRCLSLLTIFTASFSMWIILEKEKIFCKEVIIFVFAHPNRPCHDRAQFSASSTAFCSGMRESFSHMGCSWCRRASSA